jgi:hypothetical protein
MVEVVRQSVPDNLHHPHVQQPFTYEKPVAASAVLGTVCLRTSTSLTSNNLLRMKNQSLPVQF